ncbi:MAG: hypothetical protein LBD77_04540 [Bifidobacteriaceae bacterium]|nr:hypothetical protein [Bifidobacteriaceae bacterium]
MTGPQYLALEKALLGATAPTYTTVPPVSAQPGATASYTAPPTTTGVSAGSAAADGAPERALRCGLCRKAWGGDLVCGDCGALVYGEEAPVVAVAPFAGEPAPTASADAQAAVEAAVAAAVRPWSSQHGPHVYAAPERGRTELRPAQERLPRPEPAADSPLALGAGTGGLAPAAPMAMMWPTSAGGVPMGVAPGYELQAGAYVAQPYAAPAAQPYAAPAAQPVAQPFAQPFAQPVAQPFAQPFLQPLTQPLAATDRPSVAVGVLGAPAPQPAWPAGVPRAIGDARPSYRTMAQLSTRAVATPAPVPQPWVLEAALATVAAAIVAVAVVVWVRIREQIQGCVGGCPDLDAVVSAVQVNGWTIIGLAGAAAVMAGFSLRRTRGTDVLRAFGALCLIGALVMIVLGSLVLNTSLP